MAIPTLPAKGSTDWYDWVQALDAAARVTGLTATDIKTAAYTASAQDLVLVDSTSAAVMITLPSAPADRSRVTVKLILSAAPVNPVAIATSGADLFNRVTGPTSISLSLLNQAMTVQYVAASKTWIIVADDFPLSQLDARTDAKIAAQAASDAATYVQLRGAWTAGTAYPKNSLVIQAGAVYLAAVDIPARATFTAADWQPLGGAAAAAITTTSNGDGFLTVTGSGVTDNGDGFLTLIDSTVTDNGDGYVALAA